MDRGGRSQGLRSEVTKASSGWRRWHRQASQGPVSGHPTWRDTDRDREKEKEKQR